MLLAIFMMQKLPNTALNTHLTVGVVFSPQTILCNHCHSGNAAVPYQRSFKPSCKPSCARARAHAAYMLATKLCGSL